MPLSEQSPVPLHHSQGSPDNATAKAGASISKAARLSYKFQRVREKIRAAVENGELTGRLPGERQLAQRFSVNAKTLGKALTDLAAEGVLERRIGLGTFVAGCVPSGSARGRWLLICKNDSTALARALSKHNANLEFVRDPASLRPSSLAGASAVILTDGLGDDKLARDIIVRGQQLVRVGSHNSTMSTHAVEFDWQTAAAECVRRALAMGHRKFGIISKNRAGATAHLTLSILRGEHDHASARRYTPEQLPNANLSRHTVLLCEGQTCATATLEHLATAGLNVPRDLSLLMVGPTDDTAPCTGVTLGVESIAACVATLLADRPTRPMTFFLRGQFVHHGTLATAHCAPR